MGFNPIYDRDAKCNAKGCEKKWHAVVPEHGFLRLCEEHLKVLQEWEAKKK